MKIFALAVFFVSTLSISLNGSAQSQSTAPVTENSVQPAPATASQSNTEQAAKKQAADDPEQIFLELTAWARPLAGDLSASSHDVDRALGFGLLKLMATTDVERAKHAKVPADQSKLLEHTLALDETARSELLAPRTSVAAKMLYLGIICAFPEGKTCAEILAMNPMQGRETNNAFVVIAHMGHRKLVAQQTIRENQTKTPDRKDKEAAAKYYRDLREKSETDEKQHFDQLKRELSVTLRWDDFGLIYKDRIRRALKSRPIPDALLARLGPEYAMVAKFFPQEDLAAAAAGNAAVMLCNFPLFSFGMGDEALKVPMQRVAHMIMNNPKSSMASVSIAARFIEDHPAIKRMASYKDIDKSKVMSAELLITTEWNGLRPVLVKSITQGDVAALDDLFAWADRAVAKIPDKTASQLEQEAAEQKANQAQWEAMNEAREKASIAIKQACIKESKALRAEGVIKSDKQAQALLKTCIEKGNADAIRTELEAEAPEANPVTTNKSAIDVRYDAKATDAQLKKSNAAIQARAADEVNAAVNASAISAAEAAAAAAETAVDSD